MYLSDGLPIIFVGSIFLLLTCWLGYEYVRAKYA